MSWFEGHRESTLLAAAYSEHYSLHLRIMQCGETFITSTVQRLKAIQWSGLESKEEYRKVNSRILGEEMASFLEISNSLAQWEANRMTMLAPEFDELGRSALDALSGRETYKIQSFHDYLFYDVWDPNRASGGAEINLTKTSISLPGREILCLRWSLPEKSMAHGRFALAPSFLLHGKGLEEITNAIAHQRFWEAREDLIQGLEALGLSGLYTEERDFSLSLREDTSDLAFVLTRSSLARLVELFRDPKIAALLRS